MAVTTEIAPDLDRISIFAQRNNLQFNHFLVKDDEPLLFHTGLRGMHAEIREAVSKLINLSELRHISFSHFESDECGSLNEWLAVAPKADAVCSQVGAIVCVNDFIGRPARGLADGETQRILLCSDLMHQEGEVEPLTSSDVVGRSLHAMRNYQGGVLADYVPY